MITKVLSECGVDYSMTSTLHGWKSTETNIKCGDVRFFNGKLWIVDYMSPIKKKMFKPQFHNVTWKEYELNNRYHVQDVEERLQKLIEEFGNTLLNHRSDSINKWDNILEIVTKLIIDVTRFKQQLDLPSPWASSKDLTILEIAVVDLKARFNQHAKADISK